MKKILFASILSIALFILISSKTLTNSTQYALSPTQFDALIKQAKQEDKKAIQMLFRYYATFRSDAQSMWLVICYGKEIDIPYYAARWKEQKELYFECPDKPLSQLKYTLSLPWWWFY